MKVKVLKKLAVMFLSVMVFAVVLSGCSTKAPEEEGSGEKGNKVGISMSDKTLERWERDGTNMKNKLEAAGYEVDLKYANGKIEQQVKDIENLITGECSVIVVAPIDGKALTTTLAQAKDNDIEIISYDRLIMDSDAVSYYVTFDNAEVGKMQGQYIVDQLDLENQSGPFNIELTTGPTDDNNVNFFFGEGAMAVLKPYIDSGKLVVPSGQTSQVQCATPEWKLEKSQERMENIISSNGYGPKGKKLSACLASNDSTAQGVTNALKGAGYTASDFPILTGQDADKASVKNIIAGFQSMTVFKDTRTSAEQVVKMVEAILKGEEVEINDESSYDNGTGVIKTYLCAPVVITKDNYQKELIDTGYYTEDDLK